MRTNISLPPGYTLRSPTPGDAPGVVSMIAASDLAQGADPDHSVEELLRGWKKAQFHLADDARVVTSPDGKVVGYEELWNRYGHAYLQGDGYVHPEHLNLGIGTVLMRWQDGRAKEHIPLAESGVRVFIRSGIYGNDQRARQLHEDEGFQAVRYFWRMSIGLKETPPAPHWPEGVHWRKLDPVIDLQSAWMALEEAFSDHWGHTPVSLDEWRKRLEFFDPELCFLAVDTGMGKETVAGGVLCNHRGEIGWVSTLGVRPPWRRKGLGQALLYHVFGEFYLRGTRKIELSVDSANPTGATHLYERAGMQVANEIVLFEKEYRPGRDPAEE